MELYPLKFVPILKSKIWGGDKLKTILNKKVNGQHLVGECWEISALPNEQSVVAYGSLKGISIERLIDEFKEDLIGKRIYDKYGNQFPLLIKFIDANDYLSVQVHPDDNLARQRHSSYGKTEMWFVVDAEKDAKLMVGFNQPIDKNEYLTSVNNGSLKSILNYENAKKGDAFFIPAGRIHAIGSGILLAEIQQTSDITYRIFDWDRVDNNGIPRELHTELASDSIDFDFESEFKSKYSKEKNQSNRVVECKYFITNVMKIENSVCKNYEDLDSFVIYMALDGLTEIQFSEVQPPVLLKKGETVLIPALLKRIKLKSISNDSELLEVYINT